MQVGPSSWMCKALIERVFQGNSLLKGCSGALSPLAEQQIDFRNDSAVPQGTCQAPDPLRFCMWHASCYLSCWPWTLKKFNILSGLMGGTCAL